MTLAHLLTYPEVHASKEAVVNQQGIMIGGPDRKMIDDWGKWASWQRAIQFASKEIGVVPKRVMEYFQATKHLTSPPKAGDLAISQDRPIDSKLIVTPEPLMSKPFTPPRFTWSYTALDSFLNGCPLQAAAERYYKTVKYQETVATAAGNRVHKAGENYLLNPTAQTAAILDREEPRARKYDDLILNAAAKDGGILLVEKKMCVNERWGTTGYFDADAWGRGAADIALIRGEVANIWDRKTGKRKDNPLQLRLMILFLALYYPEIQEFRAANIWYKEADAVQSIEPVRRSEVKNILIEARSMIARVKEMWESETFVARKSGLCQPSRKPGSSYMGCQNKSCPHSGG